MEEELSKNIRKTNKENSKTNRKMTQGFLGFKASSKNLTSPAFNLHKSHRRKKARAKTTNSVRALSLLTSREPYLCASNPRSGFKVCILGFCVSGEGEI